MLGGLGIAGLVILTQTCDIRKTSSKRPYLQVSPIVRLEGTAAALARKGQLLNLVPLPGSRGPSVCRYGPSNDCRKVVPPVLGTNSRVSK